jgi:amiloride-sensitive sodium channel
LERRNIYDGKCEQDGSKFIKNLTEEILRTEAIYGLCLQTVEMQINCRRVDLRPYIVDMLKETSEVHWFQQQFSTFGTKYQPMFAEVWTQRGMGFSFNLKDSEELLDFRNIHKDFRFYRNITTRSEGSNTTILRNVQVSSKSNTKLFIILKNPYKNITQICMPAAILVHDSDELPSFLKKDQFLSVKYGMSIDIEATPKIIKTDRDLKSVDPNTRECYFDGEKSLKFFKIYSQKNCLIECFANFTYQRCSCNDYIQPYKDKIFCSLEKSDCPKIIIHDYVLQDIPSTNCSCLPPCDSVTYHIKYFHKFSTQSDEISINLRVNTEDAILFRRYQQFTFSDVVSYVGGLLGLFAGISMLSIVEIFYFFIIRPVFDVWRALRGQ